MKKGITGSAAGIVMLAFVLAASAQGRGGDGERPGGPQGQDGMDGMGPPDSSALALDLIAEFDTDEDGALIEAELQEALNALPKPPDIELAAAADWIAFYDVDETGSLSAVELETALEENRPEPPQGGPREER